MKTRIMGVVAIAALVALAGCNNKSQRTATGNDPTVVQAAATVPVADAPAPTAPAQSQPFTYQGVHAGMTIAELREAQHRGPAECVRSYGGPRHNTPVTECAFDVGDSSVRTYFFDRHLFYIVWSCADNCSNAIAAMKAHFDKPVSSKEKIVSAEVGGFREHVIAWRSPQETASVVGNVQFEVMNYDFAPPAAPRR